ncbi:MULTISPECIES: GntR family transcriptional regulator [Clostridium]|mgnify:CR=1 FL=1|jgi:transcriptional regulator, GntR family|uniref:GntR family transcriptional regulator n=4 Tax=Clostridium TaxID=1485 RepID=A0A1S8R1Y0_CLOBE|nr:MULTISPECIES: GntR family transcriptional regulator [Clostridium]ABR36195.1 transcriptional regulator, GntR family [Clostridium beijerinckii NCIMB 8052]AIU03517.1 GntR family transcriptional regulator [Clostridium beijerinckii ATCC 35702]ALB44756.1 GntR family transcriptional regulator [Clostridium beijerinckii NRRL B-598]AVK48078.1 GntR family transcriptional regulator [Clostridium sp. MF28]MBC2458295.1 GntR family transcriptional regulator [Clostridium beijerinckii]
MALEVNKNTTSKTIYYKLRDEIINLYLEPGTSISEKELSEKYSVSRTPVREALVRLAQEGLVNIYPQKGTVVSLIDLSAVEEGRFLREHLERAVVKEACKEFSQENVLALEMNLKLQKMYIENNDYKKLFEADEEFHKIIFEGSNKKRVWNSINDGSTEFQRIRMLRLVTNSSWDNIYLQHKEIFNAIKNKSPEIAEDFMKEHLNMVTFDKNKIKEKYPNYFK